MSLPVTLDAIQVRVLGALMEKEIVTPENYPLSLNALVNACNQKSSRDPVLDLSEEQVQQALHRLEDVGLTSTARDGRVAKFEHRARTVLNLRRDETAVLCLLLLRGAQTPGELRSRAERMYPFDGMDAVENTLARLMAAAEATDAASPAVRPLVAVLVRQPGSRERRYAHLLGGPVEGEAGAGDAPAQPAVVPPAGQDVLERIARLEAEVAELRAALGGLG